MSVLAPLLVAGGFLDVLGTIAGVMLALAGLAVAFLGLVAVTEGAPRRGGGGILVGLLAAAAGCWLIGVW